MDYDRYDALLHYIFKQTQGDAWFRPDARDIAAGVCLRDDTGSYRVFPYENLGLEPFECAVRAMDLIVAVKVRSAVAHAAVSEVGPEEKSVYLDANTRIQIVDTMLMLPHAEKDQNAAFIRDERVLVVWADGPDTIIPNCNDFEERLIKLLWRARPGFGTTPPPSSSHPTSYADSTSAHSLLAPFYQRERERERGSAPSSERHDVEKAFANPSIEPPLVRTVKRRWYGKRVVVQDHQFPDPEHEPELGYGSEKRPAVLYAPFYNGLAAALSLIFVGNGIKILLVEWRQDGKFTHFVLCVFLPLLFCVSLFFCLQLILNITMAFGPIAQYHQNSKYYSARPPRPNKQVDSNLPHITIQMPVYKEGLEAVLAPSIASLKKAMQTYARQGGTSNIFINDDGLRTLPDRECAARLAFYDANGIGWVARPAHDEPSANGDGSTYVRAGRFKKASNMNYALELSRKAERHLKDMIAAGESALAMSTRVSLSGEGSGSSEDEQALPLSLEDRALVHAIEETWEESGKRWKPCAKNGRACRIGEIVLLVDSDTVVPEDCLRDAAREMAECPTVAIIQHESDVMQVAHHYFENGIAYFTRRINKSISLTCANGEVAPFVGHNSFLRWQAVQDAAFVDHDGKEKIWSESRVSEDFDMALRLQMRGYIIRWATYSKGGFKEGVSLTVDDECNRWQKYAYGKLLFNPLVQWWRRGPISHQIHRFLWSNAPFHYKISMLAYMFSYYGIAAAITIGVINYTLLGFQFPVDAFYLHSFEIWLATTVVFFGSGNVGFTLLEYRLGEKDLVTSFLTNISWVPFFFFFFGGLSIPLSQAILAHLFSYNMTWGATKKEVERSNFFKEVPKIMKRFWFSLLVSVVIIGGMIVCATPLVPLGWRVDGSSWAVIFPLAVCAGCHILFPIVLNPWLMIFSY
ncbi:glycosyl transferase family group 2-domain-containing protein [Multifurca ochricompacta]|uniref:Glycosyl transferase family group 2-domain-containing protein n=1 Tax=Multifurca ochricompacta TaxID=376703 RepID=A0AAD4M2W7_9AGAM|nr:glycosyl transferase family group 2-domain-containing protein [Multifurca ochricompacta]